MNSSASARASRASLSLPKDAQCKVLLLDASTFELGSMAEYRRTVGQALQTFAPERYRVAIHRVGLSPERARRIPVKLQAWANHLRVSVSAQAHRVGADLIHLLDGTHAYTLPWLRGSRCVVTIHDTIPALRASGEFGEDRGTPPARLLIARSSAGLRSADRVIAVSGQTARDVTMTAGVRPERVDVVPWALPAKARQLLYQGGRVYSLPHPAASPFIMHVGNGLFYKNREGVVRIFARVAREADVSLAMVGPPPSRALRRLVAEEGVQERIEFVVSPSDDKLVELYQTAALLLFPSRYEGFGLPPLEAMAAGCPVVCSTGGSLAEVVGEAALTAKFDDEASLTSAVLHVLRSRETAERLATAGRAWASTFTLERMGKGIAESYEAALSQTSRQ